MKNKVLAMLLVSAMSLGLLAGCGKEATEESGKESTKEAVKESSKEESEEKEEPKEVVTLTYYNNFHGGTLDNAKWFTDLLEEEVGVKLDIAMGSGDSSLLDSYIAGGELPDIVAIDGNGNLMKTAEAGLLLDLDQYKDKLPNIYENEVYDAAMARIKEIPEINKNNYTVKAGTYGTPTSVGNMTGVEIPAKIRWDLYEELGCPQISSWDDLLDVLKQMQELCPETESGQKTYAFQMWSDWDGAIPGFYGNLFCWYGIATCNGFFQFDSTWSMEPEYMFGEGTRFMQMVEMFNKAYRMGLLDPEGPTQNWETVVAKTKDGVYLMDYSGISMDRDEEGIGFAPVATTDFLKLTANANCPAGYTYYLCISSDCEDVDAALEFLNWLYADETVFLLMNGPEGGIWEYDADGNMVATEQYKENGSDTEIEGGGTVANVKSWIGMYPLTEVDTTLGNGKGLQYNKLTAQSNFKGETGDSLLEKNWKKHYGEQYDFDDIATWAKDYGNYNPNHGFRQFVVSFTPEMAEISTAIKAFSNSVLWKAMYAETETEFKELIEKLRKDCEELGISKQAEYTKWQWQNAAESAERYGIVLPE